MKKPIIVLLLSLSVCAGAFAGDCQDISLSFGVVNNFGLAERPFFSLENGVSFTYGFNLGLTRRLEFSAGGTATLVPEPFLDNVFFGELAFSLLGDRSTASKVSGSGINMLLGAGGFYSINRKNGYQGAGAYISFTPLVVGSPITGRRERALRTAMGYDFVNNRFILMFSAISLDYYVRGSWRDYY